MFFAKKLTFVHYWVQVRKTKQMNSHLSWNQQNTNPSFTRNLFPILVSNTHFSHTRKKRWKEKNDSKACIVQSGNTDYLSANEEIQAIKSGQQLTFFTNQKTDPLQIFAAQSFHFNLKKNQIAHASNTLRNNNTTFIEQKLLLNELKTRAETQVGNKLPISKPWYTYWLLPFLGFTAVLPSLLPAQVTAKSYGFSFGEASNGKTSSILNSFGNNSSKLVNTSPSIPYIIRSDKATIDNSLGTKASKFTQFICSPNSNRFSYLHQEKGQINFSTRTEKTLNPNNIVTRNVQSMFSIAQTHPLVLLKLNNYVTAPNYNLINAQFSKKKNTVNTSLFTKESDHFVYPSLYYKQIEHSLELIIKQLLYIKDHSWLEAFTYKTKTTTLASNLSFSNLSGNLRSLVPTNSARKTFIGLQKTNRSQKRFLSTAQEAVYFYQYLRLSNLQTPTFTSSNHSLSSPTITLNPKDTMTPVNLSESLIQSMDTRAEYRSLNESNSLFVPLNGKLVLKNPQLQYFFPLSSFPSTKDSRSSSSTPDCSSTQILASTNSKLIPGDKKKTNRLQISSVPITNYTHQLDNIVFQTPLKTSTNFSKPITEKTSLDSPEMSVGHSISFKFQKYFQFLYTKLIRTFYLVNYEHLQYTPIFTRSSEASASRMRRRLVQQRKASSRKQISVRKNLQLPLFLVHNQRIGSPGKSDEKVIRNIVLSPYKTKRKSELFNSRIPNLTIQKLVTRRLKNLDNLNTKKVQGHLQKRSNPKSIFSPALPLPLLDSNLKSTPIGRPKLIVGNSIQPLDLLRIKHFVYLSTTEKRQLKYFKSLDIILKDEKLLYETLIRQNQQQKRRKKKRKRWTRRRRKRKRKLLRPIWTTIRLGDFLYSKRLKSTFNKKLLNNSSPAVLAQSTQSRFRLHNQAFSDSLRISALNYLPINLYHSKKTYTLSKKVLGEVTTKKVNKQKMKILVKRLETLNSKKAKSWLESQVNGIALQQSTQRILVNQALILEYNRIMYERLQDLLLTYGNHTEKTTNTGITGTLGSLGHSNNQKLTPFHSKITHNTPKEEWLWLFKYMTGEIPAQPQLSSIDEVRTLWAMNKLNTMNQWTGWKNFYYQEFKKGLTPIYELWQDKKPDKRYNVNNLKKRQYKHIKKFQRLRLFPQLHKGTYFALHRDIRKLTVLGIQIPSMKSPSFAPPYTTLTRPISSSAKDYRNPNRRPMETLRSNLHNLKLWSIQRNFYHGQNSKFRSFNQGHERLQQPNQGLQSPTLLAQIYRRTNLESATPLRATESSFSSNSLGKPILDLYANWWESTDGMGWGWKTIQYGAPWDRKTLYVPTKLTRKKSLIYSAIEKQSYNSTSLVSYQLKKLTGQSTITTFPSLEAQYRSFNSISSTSLILTTFILHICACLALFSLSEFRYSLKVQLILGYKLSSIPLKLITMLSTPFLPSGNSKSKVSLGKPSSTADFNLPNSLLNKLVHSIQLSNVNNSNQSKFSLTTVKIINHPRYNSALFYNANRATIQTRARFSCYGMLQQLIKKSVRNHTNVLLAQRAHLTPTLIQNKNSSLELTSRSPASAQPWLHSAKVYTNKSAVSYLIDVSAFELKKQSLQSQLSLLRVNQETLKFSYSLYYCLFSIFERVIDRFRESTRTVYDFFSLPENFSANPDEMGLDVIANFIYDFEEPLIELVPDIIETKSEVYLNRLLLPLNFFGPFTLVAQHRLKWFYRMLVELIYQSDADYIKDEEELHILYTIWAEVLNKAAQELDLEASVIASQEDQRLLLLEHLVLSNILDRTTLQPNIINLDEPSKDKSPSLKLPRLINYFFGKTTDPPFSQSTDVPFSSFASRKDVNTFAFAKHSLCSSFLNFEIRPLQAQSTRFARPRLVNSNQISSETFRKQTANNNWLVDQYLLYKTDETDLFLEMNIPKSFSEIPYLKYWDTLQQPIGFATCQLFSGLMNKQMAKNILLIADQTAEKTQILQALAGETEVKLILDNSGRYASISQSVAVGMRMLRDVFEAVALQTPCIFVLEDIHLIGEKRPFLISDEDLALVTNSGLGLEQHQLYEKIQKIQQHSKHRISYYKKAYRGDSTDSLPTNLFCYDLFANPLTTSESQSPTYPIPIDYHQDLLTMSTATNIDSFQRQLVPTENKPPTSHLLLSENSFTNDTSGAKVSHFVTETLWSIKAEESQQKNNTLLSLRGKVSSLAELALGNISVKLDRITQLLVIMDNVRKNKGFIVFGTTNKPQLLDPALRRPGRLEETIYLPSIPNILTKWEILNSQMQYSHSTSLGQKNSRHLDIVQRHTQSYYLMQGSAFKMTFTTPALTKQFQTGASTFVASAGTQHSLSSSNLPVTIDLFNLFNYGQDSTLTRKKSDSYNWILTLAQSSSRIKKRLDSSVSTRIISPISIVKATFVTELLVQTKTKKMDKRIDYFAHGKEHCQKSNFTVKHKIKLNLNEKVARPEQYMTEIVGKSYDLTGKVLLEYMLKQRSTSLLLWQSNTRTQSVDGDMYTRLLSPKMLFKNELITIFAVIVARYFSNLALVKPLTSNKKSGPYEDKVILGGHQKNHFNSVALDSTTNQNWQLATGLIYSYIQKRSLYRKNIYVQKLFNRNYGSLSYFPSPPTTSLLLPAKRFENYLRAERDFEHTTQAKTAISIQEKIDVHLHQRVLKRLYKLPIKEFYKSEIIEKSLTTFASAPVVMPQTTRNRVQQNTQAKTNYYYRNTFLNRHRHYLTTQWWTGHLSEYNIENTVMSEIDFRSIFIDKTKLSDFSGDLIIDFPDADQHYNIKQRRWFIQSTAWKGWYDIDSSLTPEITNHYVVEIFTLTYSVLNSNREVLDHLVLKLLLNYQLQESELLTDLSLFSN